MLDANDRIDLQQIVSLYGHLIDQRRWNDLDQVFIPDVTYVGLYEITHSIADKVALWTSEEGMRRHPIGHHATNIVITEDADGTVRIISKGIGVRAEGPPHSVVYEDIAVRTPQGWRISYRKATERRADNP